MEVIKKSIRPKQKRHIQKARSDGWIFRIDASRRAVNRLVELLNETRRARLMKKYDDYDYYYVPFLDQKLYVTY
jgi:hypothetical protein